MGERRLTPAGEHAVRVIDMARYDECDEMLVTGFPSADLAREYARRRTRDSLEELRKEGDTHEELRLKWTLFGEDCVTGEYRGAIDIDFFIANPASLSDRDWGAIEQQASHRTE